MTYDNYKLTLFKLIRSGSPEAVFTLERFIYMDENKEYTTLLKGDETMKSKIINSVLRSCNKDICDIILNFFEIDEELQENEKLSDLVYISDLRYKSNLVNKKNNIYYIFDLYNLSSFDQRISMEDLYNLCEDQMCFNKIKVITEEKLYRKLDNEELEYMLEKSREYRDYINNEYNNLIENIIENEGCMDSDMECYNILYNYLGKRPDKFEVKLLMKMCV